MITKITRDELKAKIDANESFFLVEALPLSYYAEGHLPGALNLPLEGLSEVAPTLLPDKSALVVTYCANEPCPNSLMAAQQLVALGYSQVREYYEGKQDWAEAGLPLESGVPAEPEVSLR